MHYVVPCDPSLTIRQNSSVTGENSSINQDCSYRSVLKKYAYAVMYVPRFCTARPKKLKLLSGLLGCRPFRRPFRSIILTSFSGYRKHLTNLFSPRLSRIHRRVWAKQKRENILHKLTWDKCYLLPPHQMGVFLLTKTQMRCPLQVSYL